MRARLVPGFLIGALLVFGGVRPAAAQSGNVGFGVSFMSDDGTGTGFALNASKEIATLNQVVALAPVGDFSWHTDEGSHWTVFGGGIRANIHPKTSVKFVPFGQFLVGASAFGCDGCDGETDLSLIYGGGVNVPIHKRWNVLFQFDLVNVRFDGGSETGKRTTIGLSTGWGK